jgi:hypothetical protein
MSLRTRETVATLKPERRATSRIVGAPLRETGFIERERSGRRQLDSAHGWWQGAAL